MFPYRMTVWRSRQYSWLESDRIAAGEELIYARVYPAELDVPAAFAFQVIQQGSQSFEFFPATTIKTVIESFMMG